MRKPGECADLLLADWLSGVKLTVNNNGYLLFCSLQELVMSVGEWIGRQE